MEKPVSVALNELKETIIKDINESHIHPMMVSVVLNDVAKIVKDATQQISEQEAKAWNDYVNGPHERSTDSRETE